MEENMNKPKKLDLIIILMSGIPIILCSIFWDIIFLAAFIPTIITGCAMIITRKIKNRKQKKDG